MTIGGRAVAADATFGVVNPATGEVHEQAPDCSPALLDEAMAAAAGAYRDWKRDLEARRKALHTAADLLMAQAAELAPVLTREQGKPLQDATFEVIGAGIWLKYFADLELPREVIQDDERAFVE